jgi:hypothetical protein
MEKKNQLVKKNSKGKFSLQLSGSLRVVFLHCIEMLLSELAWAGKHPLDGMTVSSKVQFAIISEIYTRHYTTLHMGSKTCRVLLTMPQALTLWELSQEHDQDFYVSPEMGNLLMQLHQKLC